MSKQVIRQDRQGIALSRAPFQAGGAQPATCIEELSRTAADWQMLQLCPLPAWMSDENGCRVYFNQAWLDLRGQTADKELNDGWVNGIHPEDLESLLKADRRAHEKGTSYTAEIRIGNFNGSFSWIHSRRRPFRIPKVRSTVWPVFASI